MSMKNCLKIILLSLFICLVSIYKDEFLFCQEFGEADSKERKPYAEYWPITMFSDSENITMLLTDSDGRMTGAIGPIEPGQSFKEGSLPKNAVQEIPNSSYAWPNSIASYNQADPNAYTIIKQESISFYVPIGKTTDFNLKINGINDGEYGIPFVYFDQGITSFHKHQGSIRKGQVISIDFKIDSSGETPTVVIKE